MCVGLCVHVYAFVCVCLSLKVSPSFVWPTRVSVSVYHRRPVSGADVWWWCVSNWWPHSRPAPFTQVHGSLGPVTESTRAIAGLTLSLSVPASYKHVHITTMNMTRIKLRDCQTRRTETDCDHTERADSIDWCGHWDRRTDRRKVLKWRVILRKDKQGGYIYISICVCVCEREREQSEDELNKQTLFFFFFFLSTWIKR